MIYAFSATGATVHIHYCCGALQKLSMEPTHEKPADEDCALCLMHHGEENKAATCCTDDASNSCDVTPAENGHCQDITVDAKKTTEEHLPPADKKLTNLYPLGLLAFTLVVNLPSETRHAVRLTDDIPPNVAVPLFIQHCTYRI